MGGIGDLFGSLFQGAGQSFPQAFAQQQRRDIIQQEGEKRRAHQTSERKATSQDAREARLEAAKARRHELGEAQDFAIVQQERLASAEALGGYQEMVAKAMAEMPDGKQREEFLETALDLYAAKLQWIEATYSAPTAAEGEEVAAQEVAAAQTLRGELGTGGSVTAAANYTQGAGQAFDNYVAVSGDSGATPQGRQSGGRRSLEEIKAELRAKMPTVFKPAEPTGPGKIPAKDPRSVEQHVDRAAETAGKALFRLMGDPAAVRAGKPDSGPGKGELMAEGIPVDERGVPLVPGEDGMLAAHTPSPGTDALKALLPTLAQPELSPILQGLLGPIPAGGPLQALFRRR